MSIKRSRQQSYRPRDRDSDAPSTSSKKKAEPEKTWAEQMEGKPDEAFTPYAIAARFEQGALIQHATFGKGVVLLVTGNRIDVLFEAGKKALRHAG
jgi:hypothetical protein